MGRRPGPEAVNILDAKHREAPSGPYQGFRGFTGVPGDARRLAELGHGPEPRMMQGTALDVRVGDPTRRGRAKFVDRHGSDTLSGFEGRGLSPPGLSSRKTGARRGSMARFGQWAAVISEEPAAGKVPGRDL